MSVERNLYPVILNSSNLVSTPFNNVYRYNFPTGSVKFKDAKIAVSNISMYYSWFNISVANKNNTFDIIFPVVGTISITVPDGFYSIASLNSFIQSEFITNSVYLVDASGNNVYYLELVENATFYSVQLNCYPVPTSLPAGFTNPAGMAFPGALETPQLVVPATLFQNLIGFDAATYPPAPLTTTFSALSTFTPQVAPVQSLLVSCNIVSNIYANPETILYSFNTGDTEFGDNIDSHPNQFSFVNIEEGSYTSLSVEFLDQSFKKVSINDTNLVIQLLITTL